MLRDRGASDLIFWPKRTIQNCPSTRAALQRNHQNGFEFLLKTSVIHFSPAPPRSLKVRQGCIKTHAADASNLTSLTNPMQIVDKPRQTLCKPFFVLFAICRILKRKRTRNLGLSGHTIGLYLELSVAIYAYLALFKPILL